MSKALICLDLQEDFLGSRLDYIAPLCQKYLDEHGDDYDLIVLTHWVYEELQGTNRLLLSHPQAHIVEKFTYNGLNEEVRRLFDEHHINEVHLAGVDSELSVLATMFAAIDSGYETKILERLVTGFHNYNWEAMRIAKVALGRGKILRTGGGRVWL